MNRLLILDDEPRTLHRLTRILRAKFDIVSARSGQEGLDRFTSEGPFPVVICDMRMPEMDRTAFLGQIQKLAPDTMCILLSEYLDLEAVISAVNEGTIFQVLIKPAAPKVLASTLKEAFDRYRLLRRDQHQLQDKLEEMRNHSCNLERLATLGTLTGSVGHELNNLAQVFRITLDLIQIDAGANRPPRPEHLRHLDHVSDQLASHAATLLHLARKPSAGPLEVDLVQGVLETLEMLKVTGLFKHILLETALPSKPVRIRMGRCQLEQVLLNLLRNACDAIAEDPDHPGRILVSVEANAKARMVRCVVQDTGCGIPPERRETIFQPYFTTKPPDRGTGLGLPIVRQIVEACGGSIRVESQPEQGSTFCIVLPMMEF